MDVFGLGPMELVVVLLVAFLLLGPSKLPEIGQTLGKAIREFRKATRDIGEDISQGLARVEDKPAAAASSPIDAERASLLSEKAEIEAERARLAVERAQVEAEKARLAAQTEGSQPSVKAGVEGAGVSLVPPASGDAAPRQGS